LSYEDKKNYLEPQLLGLAETLKIGLCNEIWRLHGFNMYEKTDKNTIIKVQPGVYNCKLREKTFSLKTPKLTAKQFEDLLEDFLDTYLLYTRETEYRMTCSIFAPLQDALDRSHLSPEDILSILTILPFILYLIMYFKGLCTLYNLSLKKGILPFILTFILTFLLLNLI